MDIRVQKSLFFAGIGLVALTAAVIELMYPTVARPSGRWSFMFGWAWDIWGARGIAGVYLAEAAVLFLLSFFSRSKK